MERPAILNRSMPSTAGQLLQKYGYVSMVNWDKLGNDTSTQIQHWATADITNLHGLFPPLSIRHRPKLHLRRRIDQTPRS
jgi:hypothetical protein